ncbi:hypothetical protein SUGI_0668690 [Cryptomeria japonica]|nr:hypothetical protein SUGI_0668380 [Cryptomeria japonica]GLJ33234.1 hypothetical protein SUGI_0668690 [Cryptomeria japonica]
MHYSRGAKALLGALSEGSRLKMLNPTYNMFGTKDGVLPRQIIFGHLGLTEVYFSHMNLKDEGVIAIADTLKEATPSPRLLMIGENNISPKAGPPFGSMPCCKRFHDKILCRR